jgi:hypothetical protein
VANNESRIVEDFVVRSIRMMPSMTIKYFLLAGQLSEHCQPEILHYHQIILPALLAALDDPRHTVQTTSCYVLEMFCENLQRETLRPFLQPLLNKLGGLLQVCSVLICVE